MTESCKDCNGTGEILTQGVILGRPFVKDLKLIYPYEPDGKWKKIICPCKSDEEDGIE